MIVGLTGPNATGKGVVADFLRERGYAYFSLSDIVREAARAAGRDVGRETLIEFGQKLRREEGPVALAARTLPRLPARAVVDSIRGPAEVEALRGRPDFRLLGVDAPVEVRWRRALERGREGDVPDLATFIAREERENQARPDAQQLRATLALADVAVLNDGTVERLLERVAAVVAAWEEELDPRA